jgi:hypothetical protein
MLVVTNYLRTFVTVGRNVGSCKTLEINVDDHFYKVTKRVQLGSDAQREVQNFMLTRYAYYLIAQNGDPKKEEIAFLYRYSFQQQGFFQKKLKKDGFFL